LVEAVGFRRLGWQPAAHGGLQVDERHAVVGNERDLQTVRQRVDGDVLALAVGFPHAGRGRGVERIEDGECEPLVR
jgi:hypothetical protein